MKKKKSKKFRLKNLLITVFLIYAVITLINQQTVINKLNKNLAQSKTKIESVKADNKKLQNTINNASGDAYVEKMAREQLGLVKSGEKVYIIQPSTDTHLQGGGN